MICFFAFFSAAVGLGGWLPNILAERGFTITKSLTFNFYDPARVSCQQPIDDVCARTIRSGSTAVTAFVLATILSILFYFSRSAAMVLAVGFGMTFFTQLAGNSMQIFTSEVFPSNARASGFGLAQAGGRIGSAASFPVIGMVSAYGFGYVMAGIALLLGIAAYAVTRIGGETRGLALDTIAPITE